MRPLKSSTFPASFAVWSAAVGEHDRGVLIAPQDMQGLGFRVALSRTRFCARARSGESALRCRRPGAEGMLLPFTCPLDYIAPPGRLDDDPARFGPALDVREHSFPDSPRAAWLRKVRGALRMFARNGSRRRVSVCRAWRGKQQQLATAHVTSIGRSER